jgi:hypothetical protein
MCLIRVPCVAVKSRYVRVSEALVRNVLPNFADVYSNQQF